MHAEIAEQAEEDDEAEEDEKFGAEIHRRSPLRRLPVDGGGDRLGVGAGGR